MKFDVAVVGAGPAGSTLATLLARRGVAVALVNREEFPRDKLCGEFLSYDARPIVERLGLSLETPEITRCRVVSRRRVYEFDFPSPARGISRQLFDDLLFRTAIGAGAQPFAGWTATALSPLTIERDGERQTIETRTIVGAWGRWGRFDQQLERRFARDRTHRHFGFKRHYRGVDTLLPRASGGEGGRRPEERAPHTIDLYSFRGGYLGVSPVENGLTNICGLVHASRLAGHKGRWDTFVDTIRAADPRLDEMYAGYEPAQEGFLSSEPVIFRARSPLERGIFMIGDAAGIIDPLTGNGMAMAMQSAVLALPYVMSGRAEGYGAAHEQFFGSRIRWSRRVASILSNPALLDACLRMVRTPKAGSFLLRHTRASIDAVERLLK